MDKDLRRHLVPCPKSSGKLATALPATPTALSVVHVQVLKGERMPIATPLRYILSLHPPSRWLGGVHIQPGLPCWRWNESKRDAVFRES